MSTESATPVRVYLARVRNALDDLPPAELEEILDDVRPHMAEIAADLSPGARVDALIEQLGTPEAYAAELRAAGEYPPRSESVAPPASERRVAPRLALWSVVVCAFLMGLFAVEAANDMHTDGLMLAAVPVGIPVLLSAWYVISRGTAGIAALPEVRKFRSLFAHDNRGLRYLRSLLPAWPLVCAVVFVGLGLSLFLRRSTDGLVALLLLTAIAAAVAATAAALKVDRRWLWLHIPVAAVVVGSGLGMAAYFAGTIGQQNVNNSVSYSPETVVDGSPALNYGDNPVGNIYAFDAQGKPLKDVYLFDSNGRPLSLPRYDCDSSTGALTRSGADNRFPRPNAGPNSRGMYEDSYGSGRYSGTYLGGPPCKDLSTPPFAAGIPTSTPTPTPSAGPSTGPTTSPVPSSSPSPTPTTPKPTSSIKPPG